MKGLIISVIAVLGIALAAVVVRNATLERKLKENEAETERFVSATEAVLDTTRSYITTKYEEDLFDTLWEEDTYDEWYGAFEAIVCL